MLYFIHGESPLCFQKAAALVDSMHQKKPDADVFIMGAENFSIDRLDEMILGQSLFQKRYIVHVSRLSERVELYGAVIDRLADIQKSPNIFIWAEEKIKKSDLSDIDACAEKVQEVAAAKQKIKEPFNVFAIADAFGNRDAKKAWLLYLQAISFTPAEEIHGILWWQLKSMILATKADSAAESGLKPFVYSKSKKMAKHFTMQELEMLSDYMVRMYHESRRGGADLSTRLERFILMLSAQQDSNLRPSA